MQHQQNRDEYREANAASFGRAAQAYERGRPPYPPSALDWLLPDNAHHVLDLGAGTGKLTRQLRARGLEVTAVEPSAGMREQLSSGLPTVPVVAGTAESIPLPDNSFDCVLVAQAWHWVDAPVAAPEVARVLRPGGLLGLLWNTRDERVDWVAELGNLMRTGTRPGPPMDTEVTDLGPAFSPVERFEVRWTHQMTPAMLIDMVRSRSYVITSSPPDRDTLLTRVRGLLESHPGLAGQDHFEMPYLTHCFRATTDPALT